MTANQPRDGADVRIFPPGVPLVVVLLGLLLERFIPLGAFFSLPTPARYWLGGLLVAGSVLGLGLWSVILFRRSGQSEVPWRPTPSILERGPYRITRNPMYLQMVLACIGISVVLSNLWILLLTPICAWALQRFAILPEEAYLTRKFGESYLGYQRRVRRWI